MENLDTFVINDTNLPNIELETLVKQAGKRLKLNLNIYEGEIEESTLRTNLLIIFQHGKNLSGKTIGYESRTHTKCKNSNFGISFKYLIYINIPNHFWRKYNKTQYEEYHIGDGRSFRIRKNCLNFVICLFGLLAHELKHLWQMVHSVAQIIIAQSEVQWEEIIWYERPWEKPAIRIFNHIITSPKTITEKYITNLVDAINLDETMKQLEFQY